MEILNPHTQIQLHADRWIYTQQSVPVFSQREDFDSGRVSIRYTTSRCRNTPRRAQAVCEKLLPSFLASIPRMSIHPLPPPLPSSPLPPNPSPPPLLPSPSHRPPYFPPLLQAKRLSAHEAAKAANANQMKAVSAWASRQRLPRLTPGAVLPAWSTPPLVMTLWAV